MEHREIREQLGAYVLGALDTVERRELERHLDTCSACRDELAGLSALPGLLDRLDAPDLAAAESTAGPSVDVVLARLSAARRASRRRLRAWQAATVATAAAAIVAALALVIPDGTPDPTARRLAISAVEDAAAVTSGDASAIPWEWGTTVSLELTSLPDRDGYVVWVVAVDGRREQAGTWGRTASRGAKVRSASRIPTEEIARVEIADLDGDVLLVLRPVSDDA